MMMFWLSSFSSGLHEDGWGI